MPNVKYIYYGVEYDSVEEVDEAIEERFAPNYNNQPVPQHIFESEWLFEVEIVELD